jgi:uncharacterized protein with NAD-binding domain and iron-sulfur cluster
MRRRVVILGGGIAGLSAAQELAERGFDVQVLERQGRAGGKARSLNVTPTLAWGRPGAGSPVPVEPGGGFPGEHGFRFFPGFYRHVVDTMARIPFQGGSVADNLVDTTELSIAAYDRPAYSLPIRFPQDGGDLRTELLAAIAVLSGRAGVGPEDGLFFASKMWELLTSCEERRLVDYERINWWDFIEAGSRSTAYQRVFGNAITRSLVAAKARRASTKTIGDIFVQLVFEILLPDTPADRVLNGPTNQVWLDPWVAHLRRLGVRYRTDAEVRAVDLRDGAVRSVTVVGPDGAEEVGGDYFIGALPVERMVPLISPAMLEADPSLANLRALTEYVEWMNGIQFYLTEDIRLVHGHVICLDSPWALTVISQPQFWGGLDRGPVQGLLSVDVSDWDVKGGNGKEARQCSREEIARETWDQMKRSLNVGGQLLRDDQLHSWHLDPDIRVMAEDPAARAATNAEPLLVNYVDTWRLRPEAVTRIGNFFLASDYVRTYTDLATMEAANEAARRAVNGILRASGAGGDACQLWNLHEPELLVPFRAYDRVRYRKGLPWDAATMGLGRSALNWAEASRLFQLLGAPEPAARHISHPGNPGQVAADARASSDDGLRRWRIRSAS